MHLDERRALLILPPLFRRTLARRRQGDAAFFGYDANRIRKRALFHLHHEFEDIPAHAAAKAVINLLHGMNCERWSFLGMKWTKPAEILPCLFQAHVFA